MECFIVIPVKTSSDTWIRHSNNRKFSIPGFHKNLAKCYFEKDFTVKALFIDNNHIPLELTQIINIRERNPTDNDYPETCRIFMEFINIPMFQTDQVVLNIILNEIKSKLNHQVLIDTKYDYFYKLKEPISKDISLGSAFNRINNEKNRIYWNTEYLLS